MSKLELDDQILDHTKFVRAFKSGGSEAIHMWLGIRAYVGKKLSDGFVPADMLDEVRGPTGKKRLAAMKVLEDVVLIHMVTDGKLATPCDRCAGIVAADDSGVLMHDYLQWSRSKSQVLADRERARERQAKSRWPSRRDTTRDSNGIEPDPSGSVTKASASASPTASDQPPPQTHPDRGGGRSGDVPCPLDLELLPDQRGQLETSLIPGFHIDAVTQKFRAQWVGSTDAQRSLDQWRRSLVTAITTAWNDPKQRTKRPQANDTEPAPERTKTFDEVMGS